MVVPGIAPPSHPQPHHPGYTSPPHPGARYTVYSAPAAVYSGCKMVVGLKSVDQVSLSAEISGFQTITEVYNLVEIGRISNHSFIPGTK